MRSLAVLLLAACLFTLVACDSGSPEARRASPPREVAADPKAQSPSAAIASSPTPTVASRPLPSASSLKQLSGGGGGGGVGHNRTTSEEIGLSLASEGTVYAAKESTDRKIIRNGELTLETESPTEGLRKITSIAEAHGGFVVTSEFKQNPVAPGANPSQSVTVIARVPASEFADAFDQIRGTGVRVIQERVTGQDVSEEYLDLQARLRNKKALEGQFLEIMKQARKVEEALDVQSQLSDVRTEIERLEGRRRFLENQSALSTITTTLQMPQPIIAATTTGFGTTIKHAFGDAVDSAASIVLFVIQAVIVLVPIVFFFGLPGWLVWRVVRRRVLFRRQPEPSPIPSE